MPNKPRAANHPGLVMSRSAHLKLVRAVDLGTSPMRNPFDFEGHAACTPNPTILRPRATAWERRKCILGCPTLLLLASQPIPGPCFLDCPTLLPQALQAMPGPQGLALMALSLELWKLEAEIPDIPTSQTLGKCIISFDPESPQAWQRPKLWWPGIGLG